VVSFDLQESILVVTVSETDQSVSENPNRCGVVGDRQIMQNNPVVNAVHDFDNRVSKIRLG
jgi:hypothetical protein